jgi:TonB-dependent starch-binding outer membrane protein SusC
MMPHLPFYALLKIVPVLLLAGLSPSMAQTLAASSPETVFYTDNMSQAKQKKLTDALRELESRFKVSFLYEGNLLENKMVSYDPAETRKLDMVLQELLDPFNLKFKKMANGIYIITPAVLKTGQVRPQTISGEGTSNRLIERMAAYTAASWKKAALTISGRVTDDKNEPLPGVNVLLKGSTTGTTTDINGAYTLSVPDAAANAVLVFSYIGYLTEEVPVNGRTEINISMAPDIKSLSEVVVVGYGTQQKKDITGAIASVSEKEIKQVPITSLDQGLQGRAAGVQVIQTSGRPGADVSIRIRGGNSINAGNEPLFVIDGFPGAGNLNDINPSDIVSIEILKDASATAIYGSRGANGVVLVTTKRGKAGKPVVTYEGYYGSQQLRKKLPLLNATQYAELLNEANVNAGKAPVFTPEEINTFGKGTDWQDELYRTAPMMNHQLSVAGGSENTRYAISGNYFKQDGIVINSGFDRYSLRLNLDTDLNKKIRIGNSLTISRTASANVETLDDGRGVVNQALRFTPLAPVYNPDGSFYQTDIPQVDLRGNPVARALATTSTSQRTRILGNIFADYSILEGLVLKVSVGTDLSFNKGNFYVPNTIYEGRPTKGYASIFNDQFSSWLNENTLSYTRIFNNVHSLNAVVGFTMQEFNYENSHAVTQGFSSDILTVYDLSTGEEPQRPASSANRSALMSYLGRINYGLHDKYLFTLTARADGSSRFGSGNKFGFFPSGSVAWRLSEENFIKNLGVFTDLKIRTSAGITGNQEIGNYQSLSALGPEVYALGDRNTYGPNIGFAPVRVANPDLRWEKTTQYDAGLDMAFFQGRLSATVDLYYKRTADLLLNVPLPFTSGFGTSLQNVGSTENKGVEIAANSDNLAGAFKWNTRFNITFNRNKVLDLGGVDFFYAGTASGAKFGSSGIVQVGQPVGSFIGIITDGIFQNEEEIKGSAQPSAQPGDRRFVDLNNDGKINADDRTIIGRAQPEFFGGLNNTFSYKGFELSIFLQGVYGSHVLNLSRQFLEDLTGNFNQSTRVLGRWTPDNPGNTIPRATVRTATPTLIHTDMIEDGSYLRARNITFAYNLPENLLKSVRIQSVRLYVSAQNLFTITSYSGYDPEINSYGRNNLSLNTDIGAFPTSKLYLFGLNIGL